MTSDQQIANNLITRQLDVIRVEIGLENEMLAQLEQLQWDIEAKLAGVDLTALTKTQLSELLKQVEEAIDNCYGAYANNMKQTVSDLGIDEASYLPSMLLAALGAEAVVKSLSDTQLAHQIDDVLLGGLTVNETFAAQKTQLFNAIKRQIRTSAIDGTAPDLAGVFKKATNWIKATVPTATSAIRNQIIYAFGRINKLVKAWRHVSVIDNRTTTMCLKRNGLLWNKDKQPIRHELTFKIPPLHNRCRSILVLVIDLLTEFDGMTAEDWVNSRTLAQLQKQFGNGIGRMLKTGEIGVDDIVKNGGLQAMTLTELRQKYQ
ncbi:hypothetical protein [Snodgrassella alvi]|uniref:hypothetical protein n=1 Tax=Snodgrassella alvi TaxID=1196083 RepID=UPI000C1E139C|nr:hypothetical protein [Snodgrassella alvi]PIT48541.1 hypothetical protein BHC51_04665 [Snodgrassella alvi]